MEKCTTRDSFFDKRRETASQEFLLQFCDFAEPPIGDALPLFWPSSGDCDDGNAPHGLSEAPEKMEIDLDQRANLVSDEQNAATVDLQQAAGDPTIRIVSQKPNTAADAASVNLGEEAADRTVHAALKNHKTVAMAAEASQGVRAESETDEEDGSMGLNKPEDLIDPQSYSEDTDDGGSKSPVKEKGRTKLKIPIREVVKAIVMNSRNLRNTKEDRETQEMSNAQILMRKGIKFPGM